MESPRDRRLSQFSDTWDPHANPDGRPLTRREFLRARGWHKEHELTSPGTFTAGLLQSVDRALEQHPGGTLAKRLVRKKVYAAKDRNYARYLEHFTAHRADRRKLPVHGSPLWYERAHREMARPGYSPLSASTPRPEVTTSPFLQVDLRRERAKLFSDRWLRADLRKAGLV